MNGSKGELLLFRLRRRKPCFAAAHGWAATEQPLYLYTGLLRCDGQRGTQRPQQLGSVATDVLCRKHWLFEQPFSMGWE